MATKEPRDNRILVALSVIGVVGAVATFLLSSFLAFLMAFSCGGDGGSPYAARDSTYGKWCEAGIIDIWTFVLWLLPPLLVLVGLGVALSSRGARPLIAGAGAALTFIVFTVVFLAVVPDECTAEQRANDADCESY